jgi:hypothetical protein
VLRAYGKRAATLRLDKQCHLQVSVDKQAVPEAERALGLPRGVPWTGGCMPLTS